MHRLLFILILTAGAFIYCAGQSPLGARVADEQRRQEQTLAPVLEQVAEVDAPLPRAYLRYQIASYLWESGSSTREAESIAENALVDLMARAGDTPAYRVSSLRRSLLTQLQLHAPEAAAEITVRYTPVKATPSEEVDTAFALLNTKGGADLAVARARNVVRAGNDPGSAVAFFLTLLSSKNPGALTDFLSEIMAAEQARPGTLSVETLCVLKHFYLRDQTPQDIQNRYLAAVVSAIGRKTRWADERQLEAAYGLLKGTLPAIEKQQPKLLTAAGEQVMSLAGQLPTSFFERTLINDRVKRSPDQFGQLLAEIDAAKDKVLRDDLLAEAAQVALQEGRAGQALDLVLKVQPEDEDKGAWRDQFTGRVVDDAVDHNDLELAGRAAAGIRAPLVRASALQKIALFQKGAGDVEGARETLNKAYGLINKADDGTDKIRALTDIALAYGKIEPEKMCEVVLAFVFAVNSQTTAGRPSPRVTGSADSSDDLMKIIEGASTLFRFMASTSDDETEVLSTVNAIKRNEVKTSAAVGASIGSLIRSKNRQAASHNR